MGLEIERPRTIRVAPHRRYFPIPRPGAEGDPASRGLYEGEPANCRRDLRKFVPIVAHLGALVYLFVVYRLEGRAFQILAGIALATLPVHYALPLRLKRPFFVAVSVAGLFAVFGAMASVVVIAMAAVLIGLCYLPVPWVVRASLVGLVGLGLGFGRAGVIAAGIPETAWAVLGSMFMFRMLLYLYEIKHAKTREPLLDTVGYFFLLPNYAFMLFPVVDYRTLQRGHFSVEVHANLQAGLRTVFRGTIHLLAYRLVYHLLVIGPDEVVSFSTFVQFITTNYARYLHVSGQFHLACGLLQLFGFALPETHHRYFLATSFTDYWRRINIYWKDLMVRLVFNPVAFRLKRRPQWQALAAATLAVFLTTWVLHAYQSFWIGGVWGFSWQDSLFWGILGGLVLINVQLDALRPKAKTLRDKAGPEPVLRPRALAIRAGKTLATFTTIALLWSLWTSTSVGAWVAMLGRAMGRGT